MLGIYYSKKYSIEIQNGFVTLFSKTKDSGFEEFTDPWGRLHKNIFTKVVLENEMEYMYRIIYEVKYKNHYFNLNSVINPQTIQEDFYSITLDFLNEAEKKLAEELDFERPDKFHYEKHIHRSDIEALKVIEIPLGIFASQGTQERNLEGQAIDDYLNLILR